MNWPFLRRAVDAATMRRRLTPRKLANLGVSLGEHFLWQPPFARGKPIRLIVDPTNHCDLSCPLCPTGQGRDERRRGMMSLEHFDRLIREAAPYLFDIDFYCWGEPLLHRELPQMIRLASRLGVASIVSTHLNRLSPELAEELVDSGLQRLTVSLDGASRDSYRVYRQGGDFDAVLKNVALLAEAKARLRRRRPKIVWQFLVMKHNEHEVDEAKRTYPELGFDALSLRPMRCDLGQELQLDDSEKAARTLGMLPKALRWSRYDAEAGRRLHPAKRCLFLWTQCVVHPDGAVSPCCGVYEPTHDAGNAFADGLTSVWNNPRYRRLREGVRSRNPGPDSPCQNCVRYGFLEY